MNELLAALRAHMEDLHQQHSEALLDGAPQNFAEYKHLVGILYGIDLALREVDEMQLRLRQSEDD